LSIDLGGVVLGVREGVIALIALVAIYMAFVLLRMRHLRNQRAKAQAPAVAGVPEMTEPEIPPPSGFDAVADDAWEKAANGQEDDMLRENLAQEVDQLREELDAIRGELAALREDMLQEMAHMRATQTVSPIYGDAMQMAAAGYEPAVIAERCGIARAEAELVVALAKSQEH